jgi:plasmid stability protein
MPNILVRGLTEETVAELKARAKRNGRSATAEARAIIEQGVPDPDWRLKRVLEFSKRFEGRTFLNNTDIIREERER